MKEEMRRAEEKDGGDTHEGKMDFLKGGGLKKWFQRDNLIILVLSGVLLFIIALPTKEADSTDSSSGAGGVAGSMFQTESSSKTSSGTKQSTTASTIQSVEQESFDYAEYLEDKLEGILSGISGVGEVEVMITLEASKELVVEKDEPITRSNTNEEDSEGGTRIITELVTNETTIYRTEGSNSEPYVVKTILPKVEGVVVVAQGAGSGTVSKSITEVVQALFDVEAHKVKVVKGE